MSGKGSKRRPTDDAAFADGYDRIFMGCSSTAEQCALTASVVSSNLTAPAIYIDNESGSVVPETWWPGDPAPIPTENHNGND